jgi:hypothetical protein
VRVPTPALLRLEHPEERSDEIELTVGYLLDDGRLVFRD